MCTDYWDLVEMVVALQQKLSCFRITVIKNGQCIKSEREIRLCQNRSLQQRQSILHTLKFKARPIRLLWADTNVFHFSLPISDIFVVLKQDLFCLQPNIFQLQLKDIAVHVFFRPHKQRKLFHKLYYFMRQNTVLPCEAKYILLKLFCHQPNMIG